MDISIAEVRFSGLNVGSGKKIKMVEMVAQPDKIIPPQYVPARIIPEYEDPITGETIPEEIIPAQTIPEQRVSLDPVPTFTGYKWQYEVQLNLTPCSQASDGLQPITGEARMVLESIMGFKSVLHYDLELDTEESDVEPSVVLLGQGVMQWVGQQIASARATWDNKTISIGMS